MFFVAWLFKKVLYHGHLFHHNHWKILTFQMVIYHQLKKKWFSILFTFFCRFLQAILKYFVCLWWLKCPYQKDWQTYYGRSDRSGELYYDFSRMTLLRWLTFLLGFLTVIHTVLLFWIYLSLLTLVVVLQWLSLHWEILIMFLSQFPSTFHQNSKRYAPFIV